MTIPGGTQNGTCNREGCWPQGLHAQHGHLEGQQLGVCVQQGQQVLHLSSLGPGDGPDSFFS